MSVPLDEGLRALMRVRAVDQIEEARYHEGRGASMRANARALAATWQLDLDEIEKEAAGRSQAE